ncbi:LssY C-terminal domain-containing protein [Kocuria sp.]|uniref:LssY C-terminal domain-containing protein n=1 Tax=Kocuria sp. TaxID=1871328 RepID=UPI0026E0FAC3|nr:LssY C-terminal domain-containing protein [Kocuria sp.]MDO5618789.1 LssY C-terminal domain-containing protein [Kocuria sp.]
MAAESETQGADGPETSAHPVPVRYVSSGRVARRRLRLRRNEVLDTVLLLMGGILAAWLAVVCVLDISAGNTSRLLLLIPFWAVLSYVSLPRIHEVLAQLYLPDYYMGRTRTDIGILGDPVNMAFCGSPESLRSALSAAGWIEADPLDTRSTLKMIVATLTRRSYPSAPVSTLELFGRPQDLAFQRLVGHTTSQRHHIRLWRAPTGWRLPGGHPVDWVAAATFDRGIGFSLFTMQVTHKVDADIDAERDYMVAMVEQSTPAAQWSLLDVGVPFHTRNGGGDNLESDGRVALADMTARRHTDSGRGAISASQPHSPGEEYSSADDEEYSNQQVAREPRLIQSSDLRVPRLRIPPVPLIVSAAILLVRWTADVWHTTALHREGTAVVLLPGLTPNWPQWLLLSCYWMAVLVLAALLTAVLRRNSWARLILVAISVGDAAIRLAAVTGATGGPAPWMELINAGVSVIVVIAMTSQSARKWVHPVSGAGPAGAAPPGRALLG